MRWLPSACPRRRRAAAAPDSRVPPAPPRERSMSGAMLKHVERLICLNVPFVDALLMSRAQAEEMDRSLTAELGTNLFDTLHSLPVPTYDLDEYNTQKAALAAAAAAAAAPTAEGAPQPQDGAAGGAAPGAGGAAAAAAAASAAKKPRLTK